VGSERGGGLSDLSEDPTPIVTLNLNIQPQPQTLNPMGGEVHETILHERATDKRYRHRELFAEDYRRILDTVF
jgi:hypothetical protein